jgi:hypothetical protein
MSRASGRIPLEGGNESASTSSRRSARTSPTAFDNFAERIQNSERRYDDALHAKLNAVAAGIADLM